MRAGAVLRRGRALPVGGRGGGRGAAAQPLRRAARTRPAPAAVARRRGRTLQQNWVSTHACFAMPVLFVNVTVVDLICTVHVSEVI